MSDLKKFRKIKGEIQALSEGKCPINRIRAMSQEKGFLDIRSVCANAKRELIANIHKMESQIETDLQAFLESPEQIKQHQALIEKDTEYRLSALEEMVFNIAFDPEVEDKSKEIEKLLAAEKENYQEALKDIGRGSKKLSEAERELYLNQYSDGIEKIRSTYSFINTDSPDIKNDFFNSLEEKQQKALEAVQEKKSAYEEIQTNFLTNHSLSAEHKDLQKEKLALDKIVKELPTSTKNLIDKTMSELSSQEKYIQAIQEQINMFQSHAEILRLRQEDTINDRFSDDAAPFLSLKTSKHGVAADTIDKIADSLNRDLQELQNPSLSIMDRRTKISEFKEKVIEEMDTHSALLNTHRDLKGIALKLVNLVNSLCQKITGSHFSIFSTTSGSLLRDIAKTSEQEAAPRPKL